MSGERVLVCVIDNLGGMADVSRAYLNYFKNTPEKQAGLLILRETKLTDPDSDNHEAVTVVKAKNLQDENEWPELKLKIEDLVSKFSPDIIVVDALSYPFFEDSDIPLVADVHYLMAVNNSSHRGNSLEGFLKVPLTSEEDLSLRHTLLKKEWNEKKLFNRVRGIICNSATTFNDLQEILPGEENKKYVELVPVKSVMSEMKFISPSKRKIEFAYSGRFNSLKGVDHLGGIARGFPEMKIRAYGIKEEIAQDFHELFGADNLLLSPWIADQEKLQDKLAGSRFQIFPSYYEPWGLSLQKALSSGAICIANEKSGGHREQIEHGKNGFLLDFDHPEFLRSLGEILTVPVEILDEMAELNRKINAPQSGRYVNEILNFSRNVLNEKN